MPPRHRRTPSIPLKVRRVSVSHNSLGRPYDAVDSQDEEVDTLLSPSAADLPSVLPSSINRARTKPSVEQDEQDDADLVDERDADSDHQGSGNNASEKYGFLVYAASLVGWYLYLFWAFVPDKYIKAVGLEWYPSR